MYRWMLFASVQSAHQHTHTHSLTHSVSHISIENIFIPYIYIYCGGLHNEDDGNVVLPLPFNSFSITMASARNLRQKCCKYIVCILLFSLHFYPDIESFAAITSIDCVVVFHRWQEEIDTLWHFWISYSLFICVYRHICEIYIYVIHMK